MRCLQILLATAMCIFGCALLVAGLALPPAGIIDSSLLVAYGETLTFAGALIGVDYHYFVFFSNYSILWYYLLSELTSLRTRPQASSSSEVNPSAVLLNRLPFPTLRTRKVASLSDGTN